LTIDLVDDVGDEEAITNEVNLVGYSSDDDENDVEDEVVFIEAVVVSAILFSLRSII
jgi:hypothetical protein